MHSLVNAVQVCTEQNGNICALDFSVSKKPHANMYTSAVTTYSFTYIRRLEQNVRNFRGNTMANTATKFPPLQKNAQFSPPIERPISQFCFSFLLPLRKKWQLFCTGQKKFCQFSQRTKEPRKMLVGVLHTALTFSSRSIVGCRSSPKSMKVHSMPSRWYSACSRMNIVWLNSCWSFSFV